MRHARLPRRVLRNCASAVSACSGSIGLTGPALRLARSRGDSLLRKANFFASLTPILFRKRTCSNAPFISLPIQKRWGHLNRGYSLLTRMQAIFLDGHLLLEQIARSRSGRFFNFNGTAGLWRRSCIEQSGGWQYDTLCEDLDLSYRAQLKGWKFIYLSDVVTPAELPVDMNGFKSQQHRWTKGSVQTCKKLLPSVWRSQLPFAIKLEATCHLMSNFAYLLLAILCVLLYPSSGGPSVGWVRTVLVEIPIFLAASASVGLFYICAQRELHPATWIKDLLFLPCMLALGIGLSLNNARAVVEAMINHKSDFTRTPKYGIERKSQSWRSCKYRPLKSALPLAELGFAIYFTY